MFSVALSVGRALTRPPGRYPAHSSAEFGLSSPAARRRRERPSGPAANTVIIFDARALDLGLQTADVEGACGPKPDAEVWGPTSGAGGMLFCAVHDSPHR